MTGEANYSLDRPCALREVTRWSAETDVIVVGFGAAGASAAIEAARAGAHVALFEATSGDGGTSALSGGEIYLGGGGGTPIQRAAGSVAVTLESASSMGSQRVARPYAARASALRAAGSASAGRC